MADEALNFLVKMRDEASAELKKLGVAFEDTGHKAGAAHSEINEGLKGIKEGAKLAQEGIEAFLGVYASTEIVNRAIDAYSKVEQGLFDIGRSTGLAGHELKDFGETFEQATRAATQLTPELLKVADVLFKAGLEATQVGVATQHLADVSSITHIPVGELATDMTRLVAVMGEAPERVIQASDTFAVLSAHARDGGAEMLRIEGILGRQLGGSLKITTDQVQALAGALANLGGGRGGLIGANVLAREMEVLAKAADEGGTKLEVIANAMGLTTTEAKAFIATDIVGATTKFNKAFGDSASSVGDMDKTLHQVGLTYTELQRGGVFSPEFQKRYAESIKLATDSWGNHNKVVQQAMTYSGLYKNTVDALSKAFDNANKELGEVLTPGFKHFNEVLTQGLEEVVVWFKYLGSDAKSIIAGIIAYTPAVVGLAAGIKAIGYAFKFAFLENPVGLIIVGITTALVLGYEAWKNWGSIVDTIRDKNSGWDWLEPAVNLIDKINEKLKSLRYSNLTLLESVSPEIVEGDERQKRLMKEMEQGKQSRALQTWIDQHPGMGIDLGTQGGPPQLLKEITPFGGQKTAQGPFGPIPADFLQDSEEAKKGKLSPYLEQIKQIEAQTEATNKLADSQRNLTGEAKAIQDALTKLGEKYFDDEKKITALTASTVENAKAIYALSHATQTAAAGLADFFGKFSHDAMDAGKAVKDIMSTTMTTIEDTIIKSLDRTKVNWREFTKAILSEILKVGAIRPLLATVLGDGKSESGGIGSSLVSLAQGGLKPGSLSGGLTSGTDSILASKNVAHMDVATMQVGAVTGIGGSIGAPGVPGIPGVPGAAGPAGEAAVAESVAVRAASSTATPNLTGGEVPTGPSLTGAPAPTVGTVSSFLPLSSAFTRAFSDQRPLSPNEVARAPVPAGPQLASPLDWLLKMLGGTHPTSEGFIGPPIPQAMGGVWSGLSAYSNKIVDRPTMFAKGGVMGEAGPEAIMPLARGADGKLGIRGGGDVHYNPEMHFHINGGGSDSKSAPSSTEMDRFGKHLDDKVRGTVLDTIHQQMRPGGMLAGAGSI